VDPHQDEFHPLFCGEGVPDFFVEHLASGPAVTDFPVPVTKTPFGTSPPSRSQCGKHSSFSYVGGVAIGRSREQGAVLIDTRAGGQGGRGRRVIVAAVSCGSGLFRGRGIGSVRMPRT
jgi:hypothetical protein